MQPWKGTMSSETYRDTPAERNRQYVRNRSRAGLGRGLDRRTPIQITAPIETALPIRLTRPAA